MIRRPPHYKLPMLSRFEIRRVLNVALGMNCKVMRKQFNTLADPGKVALITWTNKEHLLKIVASHQPGEPFKLDDIMDYELTENTAIHHLKKAFF